MNHSILALPQLLTLVSIVGGALSVSAQAAPRQSASESTSIAAADSAPTGKFQAGKRQAHAALQVLDADQRLSDHRRQPLKDLNGYFPFTVPVDKPSWESRAEALRQRILIATGLWPLPERTPLNPVLHGKVKRDGFTIEKVYFESVPGHFVTGMLFRPENVVGQVPGVLCPHGHGGRMQQLDAKTVRQMITRGEERFEASGRYPKLARCAQLARMGCVTFMFDMLGYADSQQISYQVAHRYAEPRPQYADGKTGPNGAWGFYTPQAELRLQSIMGLQTWNAIRALDFLEQLPDTDPQRLAVTGNSGGGTQTILLGALDPRVVASFPNGMVSVSMQGGCTCENCSLLRIGTGNVELAALMAPRPQAMTAADDWTIKMMSDGYPQLQQVYQLYDKRKNVLCRDFTHFPHNFNYVTRAVMYQWFNEHLKLGLDDPIVEEDWPTLSAAEAAIWNDQHPQPAGGDAHEQSVTKFFDDQATLQIDALLTQRTDALAPYRGLVGAAWETIIHRSRPAATDLRRETVDRNQHDGYLLSKEIVRLPAYSEAIAVVSLAPVPPASKQDLVVWVDGIGKSSLLTDAGELVDEARQLLNDGSTILAADLFGQGEASDTGAPLEQQPVVDNRRQYAGYTFTYNDTLFVRRVHDVITLLALARAGDWKSSALTLYGRGGAEPIAAAAAIGSQDILQQLRLADADFRFANITTYRDPYFVPGAVKYDDLPGLLALVAPTPISVVNGALPEKARRAQRLR